MVAKSLHEEADPDHIRLGCDSTFQFDQLLRSLENRASQPAFAEVLGRAHMESFVVEQPPKYELIMSYYGYAHGVGAQFVHP